MEDFEAAHDRVMSLGAKVLKAAEDVESLDNFQVYADPLLGAHFVCAGFNDASEGAEPPGKGSDS